MMGWLIAFGIIALFAMIPLGVLVRYDENGFVVRIVAWILRFTVFPFPKKKKKKTKVKPATKVEKETAVAKAQADKPVEPQPTIQEKSKEVSKKPSAGGSIRDFFPFIRLGLDFMNQFRKKLRINHLRLKLILGGDDPCDLAVNYGRAWAALGNFLPALDKVFFIQKRDCEVECDFTASETKICAQFEMTIRLGRIVCLGVVYGIRGIKELLIFKKKRKGGAVS